MSAAASNLPPCGLYRTGIALSGREEQVPAGRLVQFHNHSSSGLPVVQTPLDNENNRWRFGDRGFRVERSDFMAALVRLLPEGLYLLKAPVSATGEAIIPARALVQLGYTREAQPILFVGRWEENAIVFPERGRRFEDTEIFALLEEADFVVGAPRLLH